MSWREIYRQKVTDVDTALQAIQSGDRIYVGGGAGVPKTQCRGLVRRAPELRNVEVAHILTFADAPYADPQYQESFRVNALFIGPNVRSAVQEGRATHAGLLSEIPPFRTILPLDVALSLLTPPAHGFCSFVEWNTTKPATELARIVFAEINPRMPRTLATPSSTSAGSPTLSR